MRYLVRSRLRPSRYVWRGTALALGLIVLVALALPLAGIPVFGEETDPPPSAVDRTGRTVAATPVAPMRAVRLIAPDAQARPTERTFFGRIVARETVDLSFEVSGELASFPVTEGETIARGQILASLDLAPFLRDVERRELMLEQADRALARAEALAARNVTTRVQAEDAETERDLRDVELRDARDALDDAVIRAPFDALVATRLTANFTHVDPGHPIVRLHDMSEVRVEIDVPEQLFLRLGSGDALNFAALMPGHDAPVPLRLVEFEAQTAGVGQTYLVSLALPPLDLPGLIPGVSATVIASTGAIDTAVRLPASAVIVGADRSPQVMLFDDLDGTYGIVERAMVSVTSTTGTDFIVEGLPPGAEVVAAGAHLLRPGQTVRRFTGLSTDD